MNEKEAIWRTVEVLKDGLPDEVTVRTEGGGEFMEFPCVIISWSQRRLDRLHGNNPYAGMVYDEDGNAVGRVLHTYFEMRLDLWIKTYDDEPIRQRPEGSYGEEGRDDITNMVSEIFVPFEYEPETFHEDAYEFQVEDTLSRADPTQEPNWMETDQVVTFRYLKEIIDAEVDYLDSIDTTIENTVSDGG